MKKQVTTTTTISDVIEELSPQQLLMWASLSKKACKAYKYHQQRMDELLKVAEAVAIDFDYI